MPSTFRRILLYPRATLLVALLLLSIPWFYFGVQMQDMGWQLSKSWLMIEHPKAAYWDAAWLSNMLPGLWMKLGEYSLLWMRFGYIPVLALTLLLLHRLLAPVYRNAEIIPALILTWLLSSAGANTFVADYYIVPPIFALGSIAAFQAARRYSGRSRHLLLLLCGVCFALLLQARLPSAPLIILFPLIVLLYHHTRPKGTPASGYRWPDMVPIILGIIAGTALVMIVLEACGLLDVAIGGMIGSLQQGSSNSGADNIHHPLRLLADTVIRYAKALAIGGVLLSGIWLFDRVIVGKREKLPFWLAPAISVAVVVATAYLAVSELGMFPPSIGLITLVSVLLLWREWRRGWSDRLFLVAAGIIYMVTMNAGSSNPQVGSLKFTILIIAPVVLIEIFREATGGSTRGRILGMILCANVLSLWLSTRMFYGGSIFGFTEQFRVEGLAGVYFQPPVVNQIETAVSDFRKGGLREGDTALFYVDIPIFHFLTKTIPALENPWISSYAVGYPAEGRTLQMIDRMKREGRLPKVVVRGPDDLSMGENRASKIRALDSIWQAEDYDTVLTSGIFVMLRPSQ